MTGPPSSARRRSRRCSREELDVGLRTVAGPALEKKASPRSSPTLSTFVDELPPRQPRSRGDPLPVRTRGLPPRHHLRREPSAHADHRPAAVHIVGDHALGPAHAPRDASRMTFRLGYDEPGTRNDLVAPPRSSRCQRTMLLMNPGRLRNAPRIASMSGAFAMSPRCDTRERSRTRSRARCSTCSRSTISASNELKTGAALGDRREVRRRPRRSRPLAEADHSARSLTRSRKSTSRSCCSSASSSARPARTHDHRARPSACRVPCASTGASSQPWRSSGIFLPAAEESSDRIARSSAMGSTGRM